MQIVSLRDNLHEMSKPIFCKGDNLHEISKPIFLKKKRKKKKNIISLLSVEFAQRLVKVIIFLPHINFEHVRLTPGCYT